MDNELNLTKIEKNEMKNKNRYKFPVFGSAKNKN